MSELAITDNECYCKSRIEKTELAKANSSIWGAIKRRDLTAINHLLNKGIQLEQKNDEGITLKLALKEIGIEK